MPTLTHQNFAKRFAFLLLIATFAAVGCGGEPRASSMPTARESADLGVAGGPNSALAGVSAATAPLHWDHSASKVPVSDADPLWGHAEAPVTIVAFSDLQCPFCGRANETITRVRQVYGPNQVRVIALHFPLAFHEHAYPAAVAAASMHALSGSDAFFRFTDLALAHQSELSEANFVAWAKMAGVDANAFSDAFTSQRHAAKVDADMARARQLGVNGTPAFFLNGVLLSGAQPFERFAEVIDQQLVAAKSLVEQGVSPRDLYVTLSNRNFELPAAAEPTKSAKPPPQEDQSVWKVPILADDPVLGSPGAPVTIVVFSDFECPFCGRVEATLKQIRDHYRTDVRIVWKDNPLPFHRQAMPAAILGRLVMERRGNSAFWSYHERVFGQHPELTLDELKAIAEQYKFKWAEVEAAIEHGKVRARVEANMELASDFEARGTPHFFINGVRLSGAKAYEKFAELIDKRLEEAKMLLKRGTARARLYQELTRDGKEPPPPPRMDAPMPALGRPSLGPAQAPIVIQEWSDFQCPFCKRVQPTLETIRKEFPDQVRLVWRHLPLPFHPQAPIAAEIAEEVLAQKGNAAFWAFHDRLFAVQSDPDGLVETNLTKIAVELGVDAAKLRLALEKHVHRATLDADSAVAQEISISGTPAFVINGYYISGAQPPEAFRRVIRRALDDKKFKRKLPPISERGVED